MESRFCHPVYVLTGDFSHKELRVHEVAEVVAGYGLIPPTTSSLQNPLPIGCAGEFRDLEELMAIGDYIDRRNENPKPFIWTDRASETSTLAGGQVAWPPILAIATIRT